MWTLAGWAASSFLNFAKHTRFNNNSYTTIEVVKLCKKRKRLGRKRDNTQHGSWQHSNCSYANLLATENSRIRLQIWAETLHFHARYSFDDSTSVIPPGLSCHHRAREEIWALISARGEKSFSKLDGSSCRSAVVVSTIISSRLLTFTYSSGTKEKNWNI